MLPTGPGAFDEIRFRPRAACGYRVPGDIDVSAMSNAEISEEQRSLRKTSNECRPHLLGICMAWTSLRRPGGTEHFLNDQFVTCISLQPASRQLLSCSRFEAAAGRTQQLRAVGRQCESGNDSAECERRLVCHPAS